MKTTKKLLATAVVCQMTLWSTPLNAQDMHFSQFVMTPLELDPSQAGKFRGDYRGIINYRDQWRSITSNSFRTYGLSFDMPFNKGGMRKHFFGGGITVLSDKAGVIALQTTVANVNIAYHIKVSENSYLSAGVKAGIRQSSINPANLRFDSQFDGKEHNASLPSGETFSQTSYLRPDFSVGLSYSFGTNTTSDVISNNGYTGQKMNIGFAVHHVSSPDYSYLKGGSDRLHLKYVFYTTTSFGVGGTNMAIQPSGFVQLQEGAINMVLGSYFRYTLKEQSKYTGIFKGVALSIGTHYRFGDAFIPAVLIETGSLAFGVSYDVNMSGLSKVSSGRGGYELSIRYINPNPFSNRKSQARFF